MVPLGKFEIITPKGGLGMATLQDSIKDRIAIEKLRPLLWRLTKENAVKRNNVKR